jgi:hypothetical protein
VKYPFKGSSPFIISYVYRNRRGVGNLMFSSGLLSFGGSFVFLNVGHSFFVPCIPHFLGALIYL